MTHLRIVQPNEKHRPLKQIAIEIVADDIRKVFVGERGKISVHAKPYVLAMMKMNQIEDNYGLDSGTSIVLYFLSNAQTWQGEKARAIKKELKEIVAMCDREQSDKNVKKAYEQ